MTGRRRVTGWLTLAALAGAAALTPRAGEARVVAFEPLGPPVPAFAGRSFGAAGPYELLRARARLAVDPDDPHNREIDDLDLAPRNAAGEVEFSADVEILRPVDPAVRRRSGRVLYEAPNRGYKLALMLLNDAPQSNALGEPTDGGNGFLMREGFTLVWSGWQADLAPDTGGGRMTLAAPVLHGVTGLNRDEFVFDHRQSPVTVELSYPASDLDPAVARLTVRRRETDPRATPSGLAFRYVDARHVEIARPAEGYDAGAVYELIYPATDPMVMGLGFAATRDIVAFLRRDADADADIARNARFLAFGVSQSGRFLRDFLYLGFNEDEAGRTVFDGMVPYIAGARRTVVNTRFGQPGRTPRQHEDHLYPAARFPFAYAVTTDALTGRRDGILARCAATRTCPKIVHADTSFEAWQSQAALITTGTDGAALAQPPEVRAYLIAGLQHFSPAGARPSLVPTCRYDTNPLNAGAPLRALLAALDRWTAGVVEPPPSRYPSRADGTLVPPDPASIGFPAIPDFAYAGIVNVVRLLDTGSQPPAEGPAYPVFVPRVDADGNDAAGIRLPAVAAPVATYLGWNPRWTGYAEGELCGLYGSYLPFARTRAERLRTGDARLSIEERYPDHAAYAGAVARAARQLEADGFLLAEDAARFIEAAERSDVAHR
ncbi:MAG TPA: alpha/beta hydrolase domain-containing protein [Stellaceae bacterium]